MDSDSIIVERPNDGSKLQFGISGILRLRNAALCVESVIEAFLPHLDEIVAVYADCDDETPQILERLASKHPEKLRVYPYPSHVATIVTKEHLEVGQLSPRSIANYYNWAFSKARFSIVTKIDHDHLPVLSAFSEAVDMLREEKPEHFIYTYSGVDLTKTPTGELAVPSLRPFVGLGDHWFFDLDKDTYFEHLPHYENLVYDRKREKKHLGLLYWHIKRLLPGYAYRGVLNKSRGRDFLPEQAIEWDAFLKRASEVVSFYGHKIGRNYNKAFEGRPHWLSAILQLFPKYRKIRQKLMFINICHLRGLPEPPSEISVDGKAKKLTELE